MKKITLLVAAFAFTMFSVQAQDEELVSKKGFKILPEAGDYAIGVDVAPFFKSLNFMGGNAAGPTFDMGDGLSIFGKYYAEADMAYRVRFAFNQVSTTQNFYVTDQSVLVPTPETVVEDKGKYSYAQYAISVGFEKRRGQGRLQGYYGADFFFQYGKGNVLNQNLSATYGNEFSSDHTLPVSTDFTGTDIAGKRTTSINQGAALGLGVRGFVGVEYFIAPKISLGGELGWGMAYQIGFDGETTTEEWDAVAGAVKSETIKNGGGDNQFIIGSTGGTNEFFGTNNWLGLNGTVNIVFHF